MLLILHTFTTVDGWLNLCLGPVKNSCLGIQFFINHPFFNIRKTGFLYLLEKSPRFEIEQIQHNLSHHCRSSTYSPLSRVTPADFDITICYCYSPNHNFKSTTGQFPCLAVDPAKQDGVVYRIPREWGKVYIGETGRPMQDRIKEYDRDIRLARTEQITDQQGSKYTNQSC